MYIFNGCKKSVSGLECAMVVHRSREPRSDAGACPPSRWVALTFSVLLLFAGTAIAGSGGQILFTPPGNQVRAHEVVELRWTPLGDDVDELEVLLSLDGTWEQPLRLTGQLDPHALSFEWRVPNLPTGTARIRIRFGGSSGEELAPASAPFTIVGTGSRPAAGLSWHRAEWWVVEPGAASRSRTSRRQPDVTEAANRTETLAAGLAPKTPDAGSSGSAGHSTSPSGPSVASGSRRGLVARIRQPLTFPMRP